MFNSLSKSCGHVSIGPPVAPKHQSYEMSDPIEIAKKALVSIDNKDDSPPEGWVERQKFDYEAYTAERKGGVGSNEARYEWKEEYGDVGPRIPVIEKALFDCDSIMTVGDEFRR
jgi:hypothetical protein